MHAVASTQSATRALVAVYRAASSATPATVARRAASGSAAEKVAALARSPLVLEKLAGKVSAALIGANVSRASVWRAVSWETSVEERGDALLAGVTGRDAKPSPPSAHLVHEVIGVRAGAVMEVAVRHS